jgi:hypothetical protein
MGPGQKRPWWLRFTPLGAFDRLRLLHERIRRAKQQQGPNVELHDPIEDDPQVQPLLAAADALAQAEVPDNGLGWCFHFWDAKQRILRKRYDIEWLSPREMNPRSNYD